MNNIKKQTYCQRPTINLKCIIFSVTLALFYWFAPPKNKWVLLSVLYFPYLIMAYYDYYYDCRNYPLRPTYLAMFYAPFKPPYSQQIQEFDNWCPEIKNWVLFVDLIVFIIVAYIFIWVL